MRAARLARRHRPHRRPRRRSAARSPSCSAPAAPSRCTPAPRTSRCSNGICGTVPDRPLRHPAGRRLLRLRHARRSPRWCRASSASPCPRATASPTGCGARSAPTPAPTPPATSPTCCPSPTASAARLAERGPPRVGRGRVRDAAGPGARARREPDEAWWRVKEARSLRGKAIGVAQAVGAWREQRAAEVDQPIRFVLPDLALVGIAQKPPTDAERPSGGCGASTTATSATAPPPSCSPRSRRAPPWPKDDLPAAARRRGRPRAAPGRHAGVGLDQPARPRPRHRHVDPRHPGRPRGPPAGRRPTPGWPTGWRAEALGDAVRSLVDGGAALAFDGKGGLVLERALRPAVLRRA